MFRTLTVVLVTGEGDRDIDEIVASWDKTDTPDTSIITPGYEDLLKDTRVIDNIDFFCSGHCRSSHIINCLSFFKIRTGSLVRDLTWRQKRVVSVIRGVSPEFRSIFLSIEDNFFTIEQMMEIYKLMALSNVESVYCLNTNILVKPWCMNEDAVKMSPRLDGVNVCRVGLFNLVLTPGNKYKFTPA